MRSAPHRSNQILIPSVDLEFCSRKICGGKGIRAPDLLIANETLYQLSYSPEIGERLSCGKEISAINGNPAANGPVILERPVQKPDRRTSLASKLTQVVFGRKNGARGGW